MSRQVFLIIFFVVIKNHVFHEDKTLDILVLQIFPFQIIKFVGIYVLLQDATKDKFLQILMRISHHP